MTGPHDPEHTSDRTSGDGAPGGGGSRHGGWHEIGAEVRAVRRELDELRRAQTETTGYVAEVLPRVKDLEDATTRLGARIDHVDGRATPDRDVPRDDPRGAGALGDGARSDVPRDGAGDGAAGAGASGGADDADAEPKPPPTPAVGWAEMDRATAAAAWEALARFVGEVLHGQYRLTRLQVPDCWPVHPRMVRELAWLRSSYLEAADAEPDTPASSTPWHIRALPAFFINTADAVDPRECRPGIHRLTEPEVDDHLAACNAARDAGHPAPEPSRETGPDRPRLRPAHFPTRSSTPRPRHDPHTPPPAPTVQSLPDLLVGSCHPDCWVDYYRDASTTDLDRRPD